MGARAANFEKKNSKKNRAPTGYLFIFHNWSSVLEMQGKKFGMLFQVTDFL